MESPLRFVPVFLGLAGAWIIVATLTEFFVARFPILVDPKVFHWFFILFVLFSILDVHSTVRIMSELGLECEGSLIPYYMFKMFGVTGMIFVRLIVLNASIYFLFKRFPQILVGMIAVYPLVISSNYYQMFSRGITMF